MIMSSSQLPEGRTGQVFAVAILLITIGVIWIGIFLPGFEWYEARNQTLAEDAIKIAHLTALRGELPALSAAVAAAPGPADAGLLSGTSDDLAAANLQGTVQDLARSAGLTVNSAEALSPLNEGPLRRIGLSVSLNATFSEFIRLMAVVAAAHRGMEVDNISISASAAPDTQQDSILNINFAVYGFRS